MAKLRVEAFNERFRPDQGSAGPFLGWARKDTLRLFDCEPLLFTDFMNSHARSSYESGLIRFLGPQTQPAVFAWNAPDGWIASWPQLEANLVVFAYDWMGRLYGLDSTRVISREPLVTRLDPGDARLRHSDMTFAEFVLGDLVMYGDRLLSQDDFDRWRSSPGGRTLMGEEVVAYIAPLFNAGTGSFSNMEIAPLEAYIARLGLAYAARRGLFREGLARERGKPGVIESVRPRVDAAVGSARAAITEGALRLRRRNE